MVTSQRMVELTDVFMSCKLYARAITPTINKTVKLAYWMGDQAMGPIIDEIS